jgi:hypothetical protein
MRANGLLLIALALFWIGAFCASDIAIPTTTLPLAINGGLLTTLVVDRVLRGRG